MNNLSKITTSIIFIAFLALPFVMEAQFLTTNNDFPIDLLWKTESYTPAGYKGKALPIAGSIITLSAITPTQNPQNIEFSWLVKDYSSKAQGPEKKGVGENSFSFIAERFIPGFIHKIKIEARNISTGQISSTQIEIPLVKPEIHLYSGNNGLWGENIKNRLIGHPGENVTIFAKIFYFNTSSVADIDFFWKFDGQQLISDEEPDQLSLSISNDSAPQTENNIQLTVKNKKSINEARVRSSLLILPK